MVERGKFIVFEGVGGCGKSTQAPIAKEFLEENGYEVVLTREPGGTSASEDIRDLIFELRQKELINPDQQMIMFFMARYLLVNELVKPSLKQGKVVLADRLHPSTNAYQGYGEGADKDKILKTADVVLGDCQPDAVLLFDISAETAVRRTADEESGDPFDRLGIEYFQKVVDGYRVMAANSWGSLKWYIVDGENEISRVSVDVQKVLEDILGDRLILNKNNSLTK